VRQCVAPYSTPDRLGVGILPASATTAVTTMDGITNLNKPLGMTSAKAVGHVKHLLGRPKCGHAGTLDPLADGVLVVCLGRATKLVELVMDQPKIYRTSAALDVTSTSFDRERPTTPVDVAQPPDASRVVEVLRSFEGLQQQIPPGSSALKLNGRPAYKLDRAGKAPVLAARSVHIHWLHLHRYEWPMLDFELCCARGTYVRALIRDIGTRLGTGGCLTTLTRVAVGPFHIDTAWTLERLAATGDPAAAVMPFAPASELLARPAPVPPRPD
jgi:tRNA pseudouridine55 synthase